MVIAHEAPLTQGFASEVASAIQVKPVTLVLFFKRQACLYRSYLKICNIGQSDTFFSIE